MNTKDTAPNFEGLDIPMPNDLQLETSILGKLLGDNNAMIEFGIRISPEMFYHVPYQRIYKAMISLFNRNVYIDPISVKTEIEKIDSLDNIGGIDTIKKLAKIREKFIENFAMENAIDILKNIYQKREIIKVATEAIMLSLDTNIEAESIINTVSDTLLNLTSQNAYNEPTSVVQVLEDGISELEKRKENALQGKLVGIPTGFTDLDRLIKGWRKSTLVYMAARPAMGKTTMALQDIVYACLLGYKGAFFSLEMNKVQLSDKLMSMQSGIDADKISAGTVSDNEMQIIKETSLIKFKNYPNLYIDDDAEYFNVTKLRSKCLKIKRQLGGLDFIVIDYVQLMVGDRKDKSFNREQEVSYISRNLKLIAKQFDVPLIALAQLNRSVETRGGDKRPQLSDLRESGSLEQDADIVMFLHRPEYYGFTEDENGNSTKGLAEIIIAKHRGGALDTVQTSFIGSLSKFIERVTHEEPLQEQPVETYSNFKNHKTQLEITNFDSYKDEDEVPF